MVARPGGTDDYSLDLFLPGFDSRGEAHGACVDALIRRRAWPPTVALYAMTASGSPRSHGKI